MASSGSNGSESSDLTSPPDTGVLERTFEELRLGLGTVSGEEKVLIGKKDAGQNGGRMRRVTDRVMSAGSNASSELTSPPDTAMLSQTFQELRLDMATGVERAEAKKARKGVEASRQRAESRMPSNTSNASKASSVLTSPPDTAQLGRTFEELRLDVGTTIGKDELVRGRGGLKGGAGPERYVNRKRLETRG